METCCKDCGHEICTHKNVEEVQEAPNVVRCLECGKAFRKPEIWARPCGYLRPVSGYNLGKKEEFNHRRNFKMKEHR